MSFGEGAKGIEILPALARTANATSTGVDMWASNRARGAVVMLSIGAATGTTPTLDVKMQHSDNNSTFTDISGAAFAQKTAAGFAELDIKNTKRYIRAIGTVGGTTPNFTYSVTAVVGDALDGPL